MTAQPGSREPIIIFDPYPRSKELIFRPQQWDRLQTLGRIVHADEGQLDADTVDTYLPEAAALIGQTDMPTERLNRAKNLKAILNVEGNFLPNVDYETCFQKDIHVLAAAPAFAQAVAECALAFALDLARGITAADRDFRAGNEEYGLAGNRDTFSLRQADVGLIGFGNLARALVPLLAPFHCRIRVFDPWLPDSYMRDHHCEPASLEDVLSTSRVIFILATVTTENEGFIDDACLALIQKGAAVILVSRAAVVDFEAFVRHVEEGHFRAATDVFPVEPVPADDSVRQMEGLLLSAHRTGGLRDSFFRIGEMTIDDLSLILAGLPPVRMQAARRETVARSRSKPGRSYTKEELDSGVMPEKNHSNSPSLLKRLGFEPDQRVAIFHADDVGMCHGANVAFEELSKDGSINCGAVMVPCPWFTEVVAMAADNPNIDLGVHLTLTSEWKSYRWAPISTTRRSSGLIDADGYFWHRLPMLAAHVVPEAAEAEMRAQIERALSAGIDVTHIDTHMGVALLPQLIDIYLRLGREYRLPVLLPRDLSEYTSVLEFDNISLNEVAEGLARLEADDWPLVDHYRMTPGVPARQSNSAYRDLVAGLPEGLTLVAVHPNISGDIEAIIPEKAHFRTEEYRLFRDAEFKEFIASQGIHCSGFRPIRNLLRQKE